MNDTLALLNASLERATHMRDWLKHECPDPIGYDKYSAVVGIIEQAIKRLMA